MPLIRFAAYVLALVVFAGCASTTMPSVSTDAAPDGTRIQDVHIASRGVQIPVTLVVPPLQHGQTLPLVLLIHGHGGSRSEAGSFDTVARQLAANGIASIRMDFAGCGDSDETFANNNLTTMLADIAAAEAFAMRRAPIDERRRAMLGFSMGGRLAAMHAARAPGYKTMVMWAASLSDGGQRLVSMFGGDAAYAEKRATAQHQGIVDFTTPWGQQQQLGAQWFTDLEASRPQQAIAQFTGNLLLIHGSEDDVVLPSVSSEALNAAVNAELAEMAVIDGADHGFGLFSDQPRLSQQLTDKTVSFLVSTL